MTCVLQGETYVIDEGVKVVATPGHSGADISVVVENTTIGTVLLAGSRPYVQPVISTQKNNSLSTVLTATDLRQQK